MKTATQKLAQEENQRMNKLYSDVLGELGATEIVEDLVRHFELNTMLKTDNSGRVDEFATLARTGSYTVVSFIKQRIKMGAIGK